MHCTWYKCVIVVKSSGSTMCTAVEMCVCSGLVLELICSRRFFRGLWSPPLHHREKCPSVTFFHLSNYPLFSLASSVTRCKYIKSSISLHCIGQVCHLHICHTDSSFSGKKIKMPSIHCKYTFFGQFSLWWRSTTVYDVTDDANEDGVMDDKSSQQLFPINPQSRFFGTHMWALWP